MFGLSNGVQDVLRRLKRPPQMIPFDDASASLQPPPPLVRPPLFGSATDALGDAPSPQQPAPLVRPRVAGNSSVLGDSSISMGGSNQSPLVRPVLPASGDYPMPQSLPDFSSTDSASALTRPDYMRSDPNASRVRQLAPPSELDRDTSYLNELHTAPLEHKSRKRAFFEMLARGGANIDPRAPLAEKIGALFGGGLVGAVAPSMAALATRQQQIGQARQQYGFDLQRQQQQSEVDARDAETQARRATIPGILAAPRLKAAEIKFGYDKLNANDLENEKRVVAGQVNNAPEFDPLAPQNATTVAKLQSLGLPVIAKRRGQNIKLQQNDAGQWFTLATDTSTGQTSLNPVMRQSTPLKTTKEEFVAGAVGTRNPQTNRNYTPEEAGAFYDGKVAPQPFTSTPAPVLKARTDTERDKARFNNQLTLEQKREASALNRLGITQAGENSRQERSIAARPGKEAKSYTPAQRADALKAVSEIEYYSKQAAAAQANGGTITLPDENGHSVEHTSGDLFDAARNSQRTLDEAYPGLYDIQGAYGKDKKFYPSGARLKGK
jgi:hypothetical protein